MSISFVDQSELAKVPYLDHANVGGRTLPSTFFHADGEWHAWIGLGGRLVTVKMWPAEACYFAAEPESPDDICFGILDFIGQRCLIPPVMKPFNALLQDFFNLGACIRKFDLLFEQRAFIGTGTSRLVVTELEYLFAICRSIFDLLQEAITAQWDSVTLVDHAIKKKQLPSTFSKVAIKTVDGRIEMPRSEAELIEKYSIPAVLATFYVRRAPFFQVLRDFRDQYIHEGKTPEWILDTERGFAVRHDCEPYAGFGVWTETHMLPNKLCSLRPAVGHLVRETLHACEDYAATVQSIIQFPPPMVPNMRLFLRSYFNRALLDCLESVDSCRWWAEPSGN